MTLRGRLGRKLMQKPLQKTAKRRERAQTYGTYGGWESEINDGGGG